MNTNGLCLVVACICIGISLSSALPNWIGVFNVDDSCSQAECCCLAERATITRSGLSQLLITANVAGTPCYQQLNGSTSISVLLPVPQDKGGFQITTDFLGTSNRFTLSSDSGYIANVNLQYPKCSGSAHRVVNNWIGTYSVDDSCDQTACCCLSQQATISQLNATHLLVSANVIGATCPPLNGLNAVQIPLPIPQDKDGFQITLPFLGSTNRFTLTYDNQYVANVNLQQPKCSGMGRRM